jgi:DNA mismatch endonuclease (patch repair protein)
LPGKPDLVFTPLRKVIFVHGCFWHQHPLTGCSDARLPRSNADYWQPKLLRNVERDAEHIAALEAMGWRVLVVWECETRDANVLRARLRRFLRKRASLNP